MKRTNSIIWGLVLIITGGIFTLNALGITNIDLFFDGWWTLLIIIPSFAGLFTSRDKTGCIIGLGVGTFLLLCFREILSFDMMWKLAVPVIVVMIGIKMVFTGIFGDRMIPDRKKIHRPGADIRNAGGVFSSATLNPHGEAFGGADLDAVFGSVQCNLCDCIIDGDCVINCSAIFGGIDIYVPADVNVKVYSNSVFGGVSDKRAVKTRDNLHTIYINATCMFGGVDIK